MDEHSEKLKARARRDAENAVRSAMGEPPSPVGHSGQGRWNQRSHEAVEILMRKAGLTHAQIHQEYVKIRDDLVAENADRRFKELTAKDVEMKRRDAFVKGAFFNLFAPEYEGNVIGWNHKIKSPHATHEGFGFTLKEKFDGDMSSEWVSDSLKETQQHLIKRFMDRPFEWTYYTPGREKGGTPRWNPKIVLKLKPGALK